MTSPEPVFYAAIIFLALIVLSLGMSLRAVLSI